MTSVYLTQKNHTTHPYISPKSLIQIRVQKKKNGQKRDFYRSQTRPIHVPKETHTYRKRDPQKNLHTKVVAPLISEKTVTTESNTYCKRDPKMSPQRPQKRPTYWICCVSDIWEDYDMCILQNRPVYHKRDPQKTPTYRSSCTSDIRKHDFKFHCK